MASGGTSKILNENGIKTKDVSDIIGPPEILNRRVKTLHPLISGDIFSSRN